MTGSAKIYEIAKSMTHWGRTDYSQIEDTYERFSKRYWYDTLGYDYQMTEIQAAFGIAQMNRLKSGNADRRLRFDQLDGFFQQYTDCFHLPSSSRSQFEIKPSWFAYPLTIKRSSPFGRKQLATYLIENKIEIRPLFTGNIIKHPAL